MKKETKGVFIGNGILIAIGLVLAMISGNRREMVLGAGILMLVVFVINLVLGMALIIAAAFNKKITPYALAMLLVAGIAALCSFTLCSIQPLRL